MKPLKSLRGFAFLCSLLPSARTTVFGIAFMAFAGVVDAQETVVEKQIVSGGGGYATSAAYTLVGTLGQTAVGPATTATASIQSGFWTIALEVIVDPDGGFHDWMANLPPDQQPPPDLRGPADIAAGDGMTNLLKYALGLPPMTPAAEAAPVTTLFDGFLGIELGRSANAAVFLHVEASQDLELWEAESYTETLIGLDAQGDREYVLLLTGIRAGETNRSFLRLRIEMQ